MLMVIILWTCVQGRQIDNLDTTWHSAFIFQKCLVLICIALSSHLLRSWEHFQEIYVFVFLNGSFLGRYMMSKLLLICDMDNLSWLLHALTNNHAKTCLLSHSHILSGTVSLDTVIALIIWPVIGSIPMLDILFTGCWGCLLQNHLLQLSGLLVKILDQLGLFNVSQLRWSITNSTGWVHFMNSMMISQSGL